MKKLLVLLFSLFLLSPLSVFADDISDFQIEGISIGDSLLDYMTEDEILKEIELSKDMYFYLNPPDKYSEVYLFKNLQKYDAISFFVRNTASSEYISNKNNKYKILYVRGMLPYIENFDGCIKERDKISEELSKMFPNIDKESSFSVSPSDPSGNSFSVESVEEILNNFNGLVVIDEAYIDFSAEKSWLERLSEFPNLVISQTLSKAYGMAGIRLGVCYASEEIITVLKLIKPP